MDVSFKGIGDKLVSFISENAQAGHAVKVTGPATVGECGEGERFDGAAVYVEDGIASVRLGGFVCLPYTGEVPAAGRTALAADGKGGVMLSAGGDSYLVVNTDQAAGTVTFYM